MSHPLLPPDGPTKAFIKLCWGLVLILLRLFKAVFQIAYDIAR